MDDYDQACRYLTNLDPAGFIRWLLGASPPVSFRSWLDTRTLPFPGDENRICDRVAHLEDPGEPDNPIAFNVEFQSENDAVILERMLEYGARLRRALRHGADRRGRFCVIGGLVNLTGPVQNETLVMNLPGRPDVGLRLRVILRTLREENAGETLAAIAAGTTTRTVLPWIPLMRGGGEPDKIQWWKRVAEAEPHPLRRADYGHLALVFARLTDNFDPWRKTLEDWTMKRSPVVDAWREEGRSEGRLQTLRADLLQTLEVRFPGEIPDEIRSCIEGTNDPSDLQRWFNAALSAASLEAFRAAIDR